MLNLFFKEFFLLITYDPEAVEHHDIVVEILDFLKPPLCCFITEEIREGRVRSVELEETEWTQKCNNGSCLCVVQMLVRCLT